MFTLVLSVIPFENMNFELVPAHSILFLHDDQIFESLPSSVYRGERKACCSDTNGDKVARSAETAGRLTTPVRGIL